MSGGMIAVSISGKADVVLTTKGDLATYDTARTRLGVGSNSKVVVADSAEAKGVKWAYNTQSVIVAASDETTVLTAGTGKMTFRMPYAFELLEVRASLTTAGTGAALVTVDINESGTSILSTKITIDASEKTSETAATPPVISDTSLADDSEITIDIDQVDTDNVAAGLKVYLIGYKS